ncbi:MAG TPA: VOC family protein [Steroidobacteraceae bacterium]|nr:VOC family protein [Steroidobacteraceae bacterium]
MNFDFGQPLTSIIQMAYVVQDIQASMKQWVSCMNVGPWFYLERWGGDEAVYRGAPSETEIAAAMAFSGHTLIELIQPLDEKPSVYRELIQRTGYGFHHFGLGSNDYDADIRKYQQRGYNLAFQARVPTGGRVGYVDMRGAVPGFIEVIENGPAMEQIFTRFYKGSLNWDGSDPIRPFI